MTGKARVPYPKGLDLAGKRLWKGAVQDLEFRVDEYFVLESACKTADMIASLEAAMVGEPMVVLGSMGQQREHPLISELRQQRAAMARLLGQLKIPESDTLTGAARAGERTAAARALASQRWHRSPSGLGGAS